MSWRECCECGNVGDEFLMAVIARGYVHEECAAKIDAYRFRQVPRRIPKAQEVPWWADAEVTRISTGKGHVI